MIRRLKITVPGHICGTGGCKKVSKTILIYRLGYFIRMYEKIWDETGVIKFEKIGQFYGEQAEIIANLLTMQKSPEKFTDDEVEFILHG